MIGDLRRILRVHLGLDLRVRPVRAMRDQIRRARLVTVIRVRAEMATIVLAIRVATAIPLPGRLARLVTAHIRLDPHVTEIHDRHAPVVETAPTRLALLAMVIHVHVVMAMTALVSLVAMAIRAAGPHVAMVIHLPGRHGSAAIDPIQRVPLVTEILGLRVPGETVPIRRAPRATAPVQIVREANGLTVLARIALIVHAQIVLMVTSPAVSGSPMGESVVHFARR
jgi:hypothetical protein